MQEKILNYLKESSSYVSGEEVSRKLKISRTAIWKNIEDLRKKGYSFDAVPHRGYKLLQCPDKLFEQEVQNHLGTKYIGQKVVHLDEISSTMDLAFEMGIKGAEEGTVICVESQTKGKGRLGRSWVSPPSKGITTSIILRPAIAPADAAKLTLLSSVALVDAIKNVTGIQADIKWPNDILVNKKKIAGILTELSAEMDRVRFVVIGVGVNVNTNSATLPGTATSLKVLLKKNVSRVKLLQEVYRQMEFWYERFLSQGFSPIIKQWKKYSTTLGKMVKIVDVNGSLEGEAIGLDPSGGLIIKTKDGNQIKKMSGDVREMN